MVNNVYLKRFAASLITCDELHFPHCETTPTSSYQATTMADKSDAPVEERKKSKLEIIKEKAEAAGRKGALHGRSSKGAFM